MTDVVGLMCQDELQRLESHGAKIRLAYLVTHPIQYQAPLLRRIAAEPGIDLTVFFCSDFSLQKFLDPDFGQVIAWDIPLMEGYRYEVLPALGRPSGCPSCGLLTTAWPAAPGRPL